MQHHKLSDMVKGWFVGDFAPVALRTPAVEVGVKEYAAGDTEAAHLHKVATELTVIVRGRAVMCGREWGPGDVVTVEQGVYLPGKFGFRWEDDVLITGDGIDVLSHREV